MIQTAIDLQLSYRSRYQQKNIPIEITKPFQREARYFLLIHTPEVIPDHGYLGPSKRRVLINNDGRVQLTLPPTVGYGKNGSYKVEYWSYIETLVPPLMPKPIDITEKIREEYWRVPTQSNEYFRNYIDWDRGPRRDPITESLIKVRGAYSQDLFSQEERKAFSVKSITYNDSTLVEDVDYRVDLDGIIWLSATPNEGEEYTIIYYKPFSLKEILFIPDQLDMTIEHPLSSSLSMDVYGNDAGYIAH